VERRPNPRDGRGVLAALTAAGRALVEQATRDLMAIDFGLTAYDGEKLETLFDLLRLLRRDAGDYRGA
jgi:DNA-binding MarR family transcriptional regulator